jgi:ATP-binding cassette subfamily F protein uup
LRLYPGNYSIYLDYKQAEEKETKEQETKQKEPATKTQKPVSSNNKSRRLSNYERKEFDSLETKIAEMEMEKEELEKTLYHNPPGGFSKVQELSEQLAKLNEAIDRSTERWMELAERES